VSDRGTGAEAYQRQALSDFKVACCLSSLPPHSLSAGFRRCHIAAMCQQAVEKSVKSLYIAWGMTPARTHQVTDLITGLLRKPGGTKHGDGVRSQLHHVFSQRARWIARELDELVPKGVVVDPAQTARNSEYPFLANRHWIAPCDAAAFRDVEIAKYLRESGRMVNGVVRIRAAISRAPIN